MSSRPLSSFPLPPALRTRLLQHGFATHMDLQGLKPLELSKEVGISPAEALEVLKLIRGAKSRKAVSGVSALALLEKAANMNPIFTLCEKIDGLLGGGLPIEQLTEFYGVPGVGKTQLGMQMACDAAIPRIFGGNDGGAVYIDTEGSFVAERVAQIAQGLITHMHAISAATEDPAYIEVGQQMTADKILKNIHYYRVYDYVEQLSCVQALPAFLEDHPNVCLIVMDSVSFHFRRGFEGKYAIRSRLLKGMAQSLLKLAHDYGLAIAVTNQVTTRVQEGKGKIAPALGASWAHACTNRVELKWEGGRRLACMVKSPSRGTGSAPYVVTAEGVRDDLDLLTQWKSQTQTQTQTQAQPRTEVVGQDGHLEDSDFHDSGQGTDREGDHHHPRVDHNAQRSDRRQHQHPRFQSQSQNQNQPQTQNQNQHQHQHQNQHQDQDQDHNHNHQHDHHHQHNTQQNQSQHQQQQQQTQTHQRRYQHQHQNQHNSHQEHDPLQNGHGQGNPSQAKRWKGR